MANTTTIILKNSGTTGNIPTSSNLQFGELAINYADGLLFYKAANGTVLSISGSGGGGGTGNGQAAFDQSNLALLVAQSAFDTANTKYTQNTSPLLVVDTINFTTGNYGTIRSNVGAINLISNNYVQLQYNPDPFASPENNENTSWVWVDSGGVYLETNDSPATGNYSGVHLLRDLSQVKIFTRLNVFTFGSNTLTFPDGTSQATAYYSIVFDTANNAYNKANIANVIASAAFDAANAANQSSIVTSAFARANAANLIANLAYDKANTANLFAVAAFSQANTANTTSVAAFAQANTANTTSVAAFAQANTANTISVAAFARANAANLIANLAYDKANTANLFAVAAFAQANTSYSSAVLKTGNTMTGQLVMSAGLASTSQNSGSIVVNGGLGVGGNVYISNSSYYGFANTSNVSVAKIQYNSACNSIDFVFG